MVSVNQRTRVSALNLIWLLCKQDADQKYTELASLVELLQTGPKKEYIAKKDVLDTIRRLFGVNKKTTDSFRDAGGMVCVVSLIVGLEACTYFSS